MSDTVQPVITCSKLPIETQNHLFHFLNTKYLKIFKSMAKEFMNQFEYFWTAGNKITLMMLEEYCFNQKYYCIVNPVMPDIHANRCHLILYLVGGSH